MRLMLIPTLILLASACMAPTAVTAPSGDMARSVTGEPVRPCDNASLGAYIGQPATQAIAQRMMISSGASILRWAPMGEMLTMNYRVERLTIHLGPTNLITEARCG